MGYELILSVKTSLWVPVYIRILIISPYVDFGQILNKIERIIAVFIEILEFSQTIHSIILNGTSPLLILRIIFSISHDWD